MKRDVKFEAYHAAMTFVANASTPGLNQMHHALHVDIVLRVQPRINRVQVIGTVLHDGTIATLLDRNVIPLTK